MTRRLIIKSGSEVVPILNFLSNVARYIEFFGLRKGKAGEDRLDGVRVGFARARREEIV